MHEHTTHLTEVNLCGFVCFCLDLFIYLIPVAYNPAVPVLEETWIQSRCFAKEGAGAWIPLFEHLKPIYGFSSHPRRKPYNQASPPPSTQVSPSILAPLWGGFWFSHPRFYPNVSKLIVSAHQSNPVISKRGRNGGRPCSVRAAALLTNSTVEKQQDFFFFFFLHWRNKIIKYKIWFPASLAYMSWLMEAAAADLPEMCQRISNLENSGLTPPNTHTHAHTYTHTHREKKSPSHTHTHTHEDDLSNMKR